MDKKQFAQMLNGRQYGEELTKEEKLIAKQAGLVVVYGESDDLIEFDGAISDEAGAYHKEKIYIRKGKVLDRCCNDCPHEEEILETSKFIIPLWNVDGFSWMYKTEIPHETFDILEGNDAYCRGIVFDIKEVI